MSAVLKSFMENEFPKISEDPKLWIGAYKKNVTEYLVYNQPVSGFQVSFYFYYPNPNDVGFHLRPSRNLVLSGNTEVTVNSSSLMGNHFLLQAGSWLETVDVSLAVRLYPRTDLYLLHLEESIGATQGLYPALDGTLSAFEVRTLHEKFRSLCRDSSLTRMFYA